MDVTISTNEEVVVIHLFWGIKPFISWNFLIDLRQVIVLQWECFVSSSSRNPSQICSGQSFEHQHHTSVMAASRETQWSHTGYFIAKIVDLNQCFIVFTSQASLICINLPFWTNMFACIWQGYRVFYTLQADLPIILWNNKEVQSNTNETIITGLKPNDTYTICVLAYSSKGEGPVSQLITVITNEGSKSSCDSVVAYWLVDFQVQNFFKESTQCLFHHWWNCPKMACWWKIYSYAW